MIVLAKMIVHFSLVVFPFNFHFFGWLLFESALVLILFHIQFFVNRCRPFRCIDVFRLVRQRGQ